ncbi:hypothetical protein FOA52_004296 [Chlamydomonas sp. UWO 241]|nr:hypothetical protein FOA52_004296 [Chlamydomonas sp. UWO 241]
MSCEGWSRTAPASVLLLWLLTTATAAYAADGAADPLPAAPRERRPTLVLQLSDIHVSSYTADGTRVAHLERLAREQLSMWQPDAVLISGDLTDGKTAAARGLQHEAEWAEYQRLWQLVARHAGLPSLRVFDCRGNHDVFDVMRGGPSDFYARYSARAAAAAASRGAPTEIGAGTGDVCWDGTPSGGGGGGGRPLSSPEGCSCSRRVCLDLVCQRQRYVGSGMGSDSGGQGGREGGDGGSGGSSSGGTGGGGGGGEGGGGVEGGDGGDSSGGSGGGGAAARASESAADIDDNTNASGVAGGGAIESAAVAASSSSSAAALDRARAAAAAATARAAATVATAAAAADNDANASGIAGGSGAAARASESAAAAPERARAAAAAATAARAAAAATAAACPDVLVLGLDLTPDPGLRGPTNFLGNADPGLLRDAHAALARAAAWMVEHGCPPVQTLTYGHYPLSTVAEVAWEQDKQSSGSSGIGNGSSGGGSGSSSGGSSSGSGGGDGSSSGGDDLRGEEPMLATGLIQLLQRHNVSLYVSGHLHDAFGTRLHRMRGGHRRLEKARRGTDDAITDEQGVGTWRPVQSYLGDLECADWKYARALRLITFDDDAGASFADLTYLSGGTKEGAESGAYVSALPRRADAGASEGSSGGHAADGVVSSNGGGSSAGGSGSSSSGGSGGGSSSGGGSGSGGGNGSSSGGSGNGSGGSGGSGSAGGAGRHEGGGGEGVFAPAGVARASGVSTSELRPVPGSWWRAALRAAGHPAHLVDAGPGSAGGRIGADGGDWEGEEEGFEAPLPLHLSWAEWLVVSVDWPVLMPWTFSIAWLLLATCTLLIPHLLLSYLTAATAASSIRSAPADADGASGAGGGSSGALAPLLGGGGGIGGGVGGSVGDSPPPTRSPTPTPTAAGATGAATAAAAASALRRLPSRHALLARVPRPLRPLAAPLLALGRLGAHAPHLMVALGCWQANLLLGPWALACLMTPGGTGSGCSPGVLAWQGVWLLDRAPPYLFRTPCQDMNTIGNFHMVFVVLPLTLWAATVVDTWQRTSAGPARTRGAPGGITAPRQQQQQQQATQQQQQHGVGCLSWVQLALLILLVIVHVLELWKLQIGYGWTVLALSPAIGWLGPLAAAWMAAARGTTAARHAADERLTH